MKLVLLLAALFLVAVAGLSGLDRIVSTAVMEHVPIQIRNAAKIWSRFGRTEYYLVPTLVLLILGWCLRSVRSKWERMCIWLLAAEAAGGLISRLVKILCGRWRPNQMPQGHFGFEYFSFKIAYKSNSFPSGHATDAAIVATVLWFAYPRLRLLYVAWVVVMMAARVCALEHFVGDVAAGAALGLTCALATRRFFQKRALDA